MVEKEIDSETDQDPFVLEVSTTNWAWYVGTKKSNTSKWDMHQEWQPAEKDNDRDLEQVVRETEKSFSTDLLLLMTDTTRNPSLLQTLRILERQQHEMTSNVKKKVIKQVRQCLSGRHNFCPEEFPSHNIQPLA